MSHINDKVYDFIIIGPPRSGTHWLAALLVSHPDIACRGGKSDTIAQFDESTGSITGCIKHYDEEKIRTASNKNTKHIHLIRDPHAIGKSSAVLNNHWGKTVAVETENHERIHSYLDVKEAGRRERYAREGAEKFRILFPDAHEVHYEDLDSERFKETCNGVLDFLGMPHFPLTSFVKRARFYA